MGRLAFECHATSRRAGSTVPEPAATPASTEAPADDPTPSRVDRRVQEFRARVLETAEALFAEQGVEATKVDDICEAADVAKRTLCNHFPTKAHIVGALSREAVSRLVALVDDARESGRKPSLTAAYQLSKVGWVEHRTTTRSGRADSFS